MEAEPEVKTSDVYRTDPNLPQPHLYQQHSSAQVHPLYRTSNQIYGNSAPSVHHMPTRFAALSSRFSKAQFHGGMFVDSGLNTSLDKSRVSTATARPPVHARLVDPHGNDQ